MYPRKHYRFSRVCYFVFEVIFAHAPPCRFDTCFAVWYHLSVVFVKKQSRRAKAQKVFYFAFSHSQAKTENCVCLRLQQRRVQISTT